MGVAREREGKVRTDRGGEQAMQGGSLPSTQTANRSAPV